MSDPGPFAHWVALALDADVVSVARVGGGDVAQSYRVELTGGRTVFAKTRPGAPDGFFPAEAEGLRWLAESDTVAVPSVLRVSDGDTRSGRPPMLVLEWIEPGGPRSDTEEDLGRALAELHRSRWPVFGRPDSRRTGSLGLANDPCASWADFYRERRLLPLARMCADRSVLGEPALSGLRSIAERLEELGGPLEPPSLLHGDLWAGNRVLDTRGRSWLIDPAAHGGHRESDLAMMRLFGGFGDRCFGAYAERFAPAAGWQERIELHQLVPLIVHAVKFGGGYVASATRVIDAYR